MLVLVKKNKPTLLLMLCQEHTHVKTHVEHAPNLFSCWIDVDPLRFFIAMFVFHLFWLTYTKNRWIVFVDMLMLIKKKHNPSHA
jgi:hypothetical protein